MARECKLSLTAIELSQWLGNPEESPYAKHLDRLVRSSTKLAELKKIVDGLAASVKGQPEKLIVVSYHPVVAFIVYLWLRTLHPDNVGFLYAALGTRGCQRLIAAFEEHNPDGNNDDEDEDAPTVPRAAKGPRFLVGT